MRIVGVLKIVFGAGLVLSILISVGLYTAGKLIPASRIDRSKVGKVCRKNRDCVSIRHWNTVNPECLTGKCTLPDLYITMSGILSVLGLFVVPLYAVLPFFLLWILFVFLHAILTKKPETR